MNFNIQTLNPILTHRSHLDVRTGFQPHTANPALGQLPELQLAAQLCQCAKYASTDLWEAMAEPPPIHFANRSITSC